MKIGTIGTGMIVGKILDGIQKAEGLECKAVYSRRKEKGEALAKQYGISRIYTDLDQMFQDPEISAIYIASPNSLHYEQARKALERGKHVICEKPFTVKLREAKELAELAKAKNLFLIEAITTAYLPVYEKIRGMLSDIGKVHLVLCDFSQYSSRYEQLKAGEITNIFNPQFAGGALMDINLYNVHFVVGLFGKPQRVTYYPNRFENGIDTSGILILQYPDFLCECTGAKDSRGMNMVQIQGEEGYIYVKDASNSCRLAEVVTKEGIRIMEEQEGHDQWYYEMQGIADLLRRKDLDECYRRLDQTLAVVEVLERARKSAGIQF